MLKRLKSGPFAPYVAPVLRFCARFLRVYAVLFIACLIQTLTLSHSPYGMLSNVVRDVAAPGQATVWVVEEGGGREVSYSVEKATPERLGATQRLVGSVLLLDQPHDQVKLDSWVACSGNRGPAVFMWIGMALTLGVLVVLWRLDPLGRAWSGRRTRKVQVWLAASILGLGWLCYPALANLWVNLRVAGQVESVVGPNRGKCWACYRGARLGVGVVVDGPVTEELVVQLRERLALSPADSLCVESLQLAPGIVRLGAPNPDWKPIPWEILFYCGVSLGWVVYRRKAGSGVAA